MDSERSNAIKEKGAALRLRLSDKWQDLRERMHHKHRFVVIDTDTFQEKFSIELTGVNLFTYAGISIIVLIVLTSLLIAFTPLRALVPGYIKPELKEQSIRLMSGELQHLLVLFKKICLDLDYISDRLAVSSGSCHVLS